MIKTKKLGQVWGRIPLKPQPEAEADGYLRDKEQHNLNGEFQDSQSHIVRLCLNR